MGNIRCHGVKDGVQCPHGSDGNHILPCRLQHLRLRITPGMGLCKGQWPPILELLRSRRYTIHGIRWLLTTIRQIHPGLHLPLNALLLVATVVICLSLVYIASATAFNALISLQALALHVSYFFPILFILIRKLRGPKPAYGPFTMGKIGVGVNIFALCYLIYVVLWMPFPQILPVTKDNMNYAGPIFAAVLLGALGHWFLSGKRTFQMPVARYEETVEG
jgi:amino acid transporter